MDAGFNIADVVGRCWDAIPAIVSDNLLIEVLWLLDACLRVSSHIGNVVSRDMGLIKFCGCVGSRCAGTCPKTNSEI